jgi:ATP-dependent DNA helicase PIF1
MMDHAAREKLINNSMYPKVLDLKVGSQVMLIKNTDDTLVNGSLGRVIKFETARSHAGGTTDDKEDAKKKVKDERVYPIVRFERKGLIREVIVMPETWKSELPSGEIQASRTQARSFRSCMLSLLNNFIFFVFQLPLILSWAMSIHKSQGQTLERVKVDLGRVFEKGEPIAYCD